MGSTAEVKPRSNRTVIWVGIILVAAVWAGYFVTRYASDPGFYLFDLTIGGAVLLGLHVFLGGRLWRRLIYVLLIGLVLVFLGSSRTIGLRVVNRTPEPVDIVVADRLQGKTWYRQVPPAAISRIILSLEESTASGEVRYLVTAWGPDGELRKTARYRVDDFGDVGTVEFRIPAARQALEGKRIR